MNFIMAYKKLLSNLFPRLQLHLVVTNLFLLTSEWERKRLRESALLNHRSSDKIDTNYQTVNLIKNQLDVCAVLGSIFVLF